MYKRVLLCVPPVVGAFKGFMTTPHVGIGYLSEFLTHNGIENEIIDMRLGYSIKDVQRQIKAFDPDLVGITLVTYQHSFQYKIIEEIQSSKYQIVVGGPHVSAIGKKVLKECKADFGIKQEGEYSLVELCEGYSLSAIKGLIYRGEGEIVENEVRPFIENLDKLPFPRYEKFELDFYTTKLIPILSSRGCPYKCIYCPIQNTMGRKFRARTPESVTTEIEYWHEKGYRLFDIVDDNLTFEKERVYRIIGLLEEKRLKGLSFYCGGIRADKVDKDLLKRMREVGFTYISFGVESASDKVLRRIKKGENVAAIEKSIKDACELGFDVGLFFMIGNPEETPADVEETFRLALKYPIYRVYFYTVIPFPGTELYQWVKDNNYAIGDLDQRLGIFQKRDTEPFFETPDFPREERRKALNKATQVMKEITRRDKERRWSRLSKPRRLALLIYRFPEKLFSYDRVWSWLLAHAPNIAIRKLLLTMGRWLIQRTSV